MGGSSGVREPLPCTVAIGPAVSIPAASLAASTTSSACGWPERAAPCAGCPDMSTAMAATPAMSAVPGSDERRRTMAVANVGVSSC